jgi:MFS family permease
MWVRNQKARLRQLYQEYPSTFWTLTGITFIDRLGGALLYPFFALYLTNRFDVGMTEVGVVFAVFSLSSFVGSMLGGGLTDRIGRKGMLIFSLISTSFSSLLMALATSLGQFIALALVVGVFTEAGGPARQAMIADLLPEEKRAQGYGIIRVAFNLSVAIGPAIGGFIAGYSYLYLFLSDAGISLISAALVWRTLPETKPALAPGVEPEGMGQTFRGYGLVFRDTLFMLFMSASILVGFTYMNMNTTLGVYLRDSQGIAESGYGLLLSLNAAMVVLFQFPITRRIEGYPEMLVLASGAALYAVGFGMYGFVSSYALFVLAMVIITVGEMIIAPVGQAVVARFAPEAMRGRYMAVFGFAFGIPYAFGPYLAGLILDNADPRTLWWAAGIVGLLAAAMFLSLRGRIGAEGGRAEAVAPVGGGSIAARDDVSLED